MFRERKSCSACSLSGLVLGLMVCALFYSQFRSSVKVRQRYSEYDETLIISTQCTPPCWQGLIPGSSTQAEVDIFLASNPLVDPATIRRTKVDSGPYTEEYRFSLRPAPIMTSIYFYEGRVSKIHLTEVIANDSIPSIGFNASELIKEFGDPSVLLKADVLIPQFMADAIHEVVIFIYPEKGLAFSIDRFMLPDHQKDQVNAEHEVSEIIYFSPDDYSILLETGNFRSDSRSMHDIEIQPWRGYGEYTFDN